MPSPGSRSKHDPVGPLERLEPAAPGVELDDPELRQRQVALGASPPSGRSGPPRRWSGSRSCRCPAGMPRNLWRWKKQSSRLAGRAAHQADRPAEEVRQHEVADRGVVDRDVELGRPRPAEQPPRRVGHPDRREVGLRDQPRPRRRRLRPLSATSRSPMKTPWRTAPSEVRFEYWIRAESTGRTQRMSFGAPASASSAVLERRQPGVEVARASPRRSRCRPCRGSCSSPSTHSPSASAAEPSGRLRDGEARDDEVAGQLRLGLGPGLRPARLVGRRRRASTPRPRARAARPARRTPARRRRHGR